MQKYLEEIIMFNDEQFNILQKLREIVFKIHPKTNERMMYGGIMLALEEDFGGIFVRKNHISFEFGNGFTMKDPDKLLEGTGHHIAHFGNKNSPWHSNFFHHLNKQIHFLVCSDNYHLS